MSKDPLEERIQTLAKYAINGFIVGAATYAASKINGSTQYLDSIPNVGEAVGQHLIQMNTGGLITCIASEELTKIGFTRDQSHFAIFGAGATLFGISLMNYSSQVPSSELFQDWGSIYSISAGIGIYACLASIIKQK